MITNNVVYIVLTGKQLPNFRPYIKWNNFNTQILIKPICVALSNSQKHNNSIRYLYEGDVGNPSLMFETISKCLLFQVKMCHVLLCVLRKLLKWEFAGKQFYRQFGHIPKTSLFVQHTIPFTPKLCLWIILWNSSSSLSVHERCCFIIPVLWDETCGRSSTAHKPASIKPYLWHVCLLSIVVTQTSQYVQVVL